MRWVLILVSIWKWAGLGQGMISNPNHYDGTYHFVSSAFPEMDSRGFYEHLFDDIGDYYPSWRRTNYKDYPDGNSLEADESAPHASLARNKRQISNTLDIDVQPSVNKSESNIAKVILSKPSPDGNHFIDKRSPSRHARGMEMGSSGFHEDTFNSAFGDFVTMRRRRIVRTANKMNELLSKLSQSKDKELSKGESNSLAKEIIFSQRNPEHLRQSLYEKDNENEQPLFGDGMHNMFRLGSRMGYFNDHPLSKFKRRPEMDASGFHGDTFGNFGDFDTMKKKAKNSKMGGNMDYNMYSDPYKTYGLFKRRPEMDSSGFYGDTFGNTFGEFDTMKKRRPEMDSSGFHGDTFGGAFGEFDTMKKRRPEMDSAGFHGDVFGGSFGDFDTMKKRRPEMDSAGFHGDVFGGSFGDFDTMKKRRPEMDSAGFHGDVFGGSFGDFDTMKKRRPEMDSAGFHGDVFGGSFGDFDTMKKRRPEMDSAGFHGDVFGGSFGDFDTMKKRRPEMDSAGFHGDVFGGSFGDFDTMKKRRPEMDSAGFHGDTFGGSFGDFDTMKKRSAKVVPTTSLTAGDTLPTECNCESLIKSNTKDTSNKYRFDEKCLLSCSKKL